LILAGAGFLLVALTAVISGSVAHARMARRLAQSPAAPSAAARQTGDFPTAQDFILPAPEGPERPLTYQPFRPQERRWTAEEVARYWVPPRRIAADVLGALNDQAVERLFQTIP
jgi:hypothetical protein